MKVRKLITFRVYVLFLDNSAYCSSLLFSVNKGGTGLTETDCIRGDNAEIYRWAFFFAPLWAAIAYCITCMVLIYKSGKKRIRESLKSSSSELAHSSIKSSSDPLPVHETERRSMKHSSQRFSTSVSDSAKSQQTNWQKSFLIRTKRVKSQCYMYAAAFFVVWTFPTIARLIQLLGGNIHPIIGVLAGTFISIQGFFNALIYFRPRYNQLENEGVFGKIWALVGSTLFFCCYDETKTRGGRYDSDYMPLVKSSINSSNRSPGLQELPGKNNEADDNAELAESDLAVELSSSATTPQRTKRISFEEKESSNVEMWEDDPALMQQTVSESKVEE